MWSGCQRRRTRQRRRSWHRWQGWRWRWRWAGGRGGGRHSMARHRVRLCTWHGWPHSVAGKLGTHLERAMSSKKKRSRCSALSSPYVSRLPSTDRRLSRAAGTTAVAAERSDPARDMGLQPAGPDVPTSSVCWRGVATTNSLVAHVRTWNDCYGFGYTSSYCLRKFGVLVWHACPARTRLRGIDSNERRRCGRRFCTVPRTGTLRCAISALDIERR